MIKQLVAIGMALGMVGGAQAAFLGRNALNQADPTCTVSGATKCVSFYNDTLDITILTDWNIGAGFWDSSGVTGSAQAIAATAGLAATGLSGWVLPSTDQYFSVYNQLGGMTSPETATAGLQAQFDGVQIGPLYWSSSKLNYLGFQQAFIFWPSIPDAVFPDSVENPFYAVAVRDGDVAPVPVPVPVPATLALLGLGLLGIVRRSTLPR